jgi:uncharacterized membrane protein
MRSWPPNLPTAKFNCTQVVNTTASGAVSGSFWGLLIGVLFLNPLLGAALGAAGGALGGALTDFGINDEFISNSPKASIPVAPPCLCSSRT